MQNQNNYSGNYSANLTTENSHCFFTNIYLLMKILYAIQGTGNGHVSRAAEIIPVLRQFTDCDVLISSGENELNPGFPVKYFRKGLGFVFGQNGGIDLLQSLSKADLLNFLREIRTLPVEKYDLVINDFEPVSAWACRLKKIPCIGLSHQGALLSDKVPFPKNQGWAGPRIIRNYAPVPVHFGFHFAPYDDNIFTPVIRASVRNHTVTEEGHYTVYLPAWNDSFLIKYLERFVGFRWQVFSKRQREPFQQGSISIFPVSPDEFTRSMASSSGVLCGAGFETPAEALFMQKKLMVLPMKGQYEQHCNAQALSEMGVPVIQDLNHVSAQEILKWLDSGDRVKVSFPDQTEAIIRHLLAYAEKNLLPPQMMPAFG